MKHTITPDLIERVLQFISANCSRDEWAKVLAAIKSEFDDETGFTLADQWSATAGESYNAKTTRDTWKSVKASGGVTVGTLFFMAKQNGFLMPKGDQAPSKPDPEAAARLAAERAERDRLQSELTASRHAAASVEALAQWNAASDTGQSGYLDRKGVQGHGVRFTPDGMLLVPLRDAAGHLWNVQTIAPEKPFNGPDKLFQKGGRKSGLWHWCCDPAGAAVLLVAEGYATAASLHQATGRPVAVAFDAGNLAPVAKALHQAHPAALIMLCGDDDADTHARTGHNPGRDKATAAARAVQGLAVFPVGLPTGASDFNDLHAAAGLDAVRLVVEAAIDAHQAAQATAETAAQTAAQTTQSTKQGNSTQTKRNKASGPNGAPAGHVASGASDDDGGRAYEPFAVDDSGVWFTGADQDGKRKPPEWICSPLTVEAFTRDQDGGGWGYYLAFADPLGHQKNWAMPARMLSADGGEYRATLLNMGLRIATTPRARNLLTQYLQSRTPAEFASCTDRIGWHGRAFVLPRETITSGEDAERIVFQSDNSIENTFKAKGTAEQWRDRVGVLCVGNSRLIFGVSCAFGATLLRPAGMESGGFHIHGDSSSGKSTVQNIAASVYGGPNFKRSFRQTDNAMEGVAGQHNDCLLILDEISQVEPRVIGEVIYMLGNGEGKTRATRTAIPRPPMRWKLLYLCSGEKKLSDIMAEAQKRINAGQETRLAHIPADAGAGLGAFENLHGMAGGAAFAKHITGQAQAVYGAPGRAWLQWCCDHADTLKASIRNASNLLAQSMIPEHSSGQVERVGARFALVGAAGEIATAAGLTGWPVGESERAARACFNAWLAARGGNGNGEIGAMLRQVRRFLELHAEGRFAMWHRGSDDHAPKTLNRAGVRRMLNAEGEPVKTNSQFGAEFGDRMPAAMGEGVSFEYFILAETFRAEVCQGFDYKAVARVLLDHGCLTPDNGRPFDCRPRLPGIGPATCYRVTPAIFEVDL